MNNIGSTIIEPATGVVGDKLAGRVALVTVRDLESTIAFFTGDRSPIGNRDGIPASRAVER
jgi:hypothetical protein